VAIQYDAVQRHDGKFNVWRKIAPKLQWVLIRVFPNDEEAKAFVASMSPSLPKAHRSIT